MTTQEKNTQTTNSRVDIIQTVKTPLGFFTLTVLVVEAILGVAAGFSLGVDRTYLIWGMLILIFLLVIIVAGFALFRPEALSGKRPGTITELPNRDDYLSAMIEEIPKAQTTIWLSIHTLSPSRASQAISELQENMAKAKADNKDVRILAPSGAERVEAAYELSIQRRIPIRILPYLSAEDLRYMIIDQNLSIISLAASHVQASSSAGAMIKSEQLNRLLRKHFEDRWNQKEAWNYEAFLSSEVSKLLNPFQPPSRTAIAQSLGVPISEIDRLLRIQPAKVMFLLGRPGSGKTSATRLITEHLQSVGYDISQISVHNDYRLLLTWFEGDKTQQNFEPGPRGGFRVTNFDILDNCLRKLNTDAINELNMKQFIIFEFSRKEYVSALMNFDLKILNSCTLFYLRTPVDICIRRNEGRITEDSTGESGYVPPDILKTYYKVDDINKLNKKFPKRLVAIDNRQDDIAVLREKIIVEVNKIIDEVNKNRLESWLPKSGH